MLQKAEQTSVTRAYMPGRESCMLLMLRFVIGWGPMESGCLFFWKDTPGAVVVCGLIDQIVNEQLKTVLEINFQFNYYFSQGVLYSL